MNISGKEAKQLWANGKDIQICGKTHKEWFLINSVKVPLSIFEDEDFLFRLKPNTITLNGVEVPAPFEPKDGDKTYYLNDEMTDGYGESEHLEHFEYHFGAWRTEEEIKQVVEALRSVFKPQ